MSVEERPKHQEEIEKMINPKYHLQTCITTYSLEIVIHATFFVI